MRIELAGDDEVLAAGADVHAVRALRLGGEVEQALVDRASRSEMTGKPLIFLNLPALYDRLRLLQVDDVQVVVVALADTPASKDALPISLPPVASSVLNELPKIQPSLTSLPASKRSCQYGGSSRAKDCDLVDPPACAIELPERDHAAVGLVVLLDRRVRPSRAGGRTGRPR